ncbi:MAG: hypothetical protein LDL26_01560 [Caenispirillum bisanense]|nr:hypothetical protein [Caenispirillum bisanense]MCA1971647.1 hypothetical protein [Caenispirillum sp.]
MRSFRLALAAAVLACAAAPALAETPLFVLEPTWTDPATGQSITRRLTFDTVGDLVDGVDIDTLSASLGVDLTTIDRITADAYIRGLPATIAYDGTEIVLQVPAAGVERRFGTTAADRDAAQEELEAYLEGEGNGTLTQILKAAAARTALDPVAGNPASLMSRMAAGMHDAGTRALDADGLVVGLAADGMKIGADGTDVRSMTATPTIGWGFANGWTLALDMPLTWQKTEDADTWSGQLSLGLTMPVTESWSLTPSVSAGAVGSVDLGAGAVLTGGALTSRYEAALTERLSLVIGNTAGVFTTVPVTVGDYEVDYDLTNVVARNGITAVYDTGAQAFDAPLRLSLGITDTRFFGDALYSESYEEITVGVSAGRAAAGIGAIFGEGDITGITGRVRVAF